jgi:hypothetical protein
MSVNAASLKKHIIEHAIIHDEDSGLPISGIQVDGGRLWVYDEVRDKWLSSDRLFATAGRDGRAKNLYLRLLDGQPSNLTGYRMLYGATIVAVAAQTRNNETWTLQIRKNGDPTNLYSLAISGSSGAHNKTLNIDIDEGDLVQLFAETTTFLGIKDPFVMIEIAWRNDSLVV